MILPHLSQIPLGLYMLPEPLVPVYLWLQYLYQNRVLNYPLYINPGNQKLQCSHRKALLVQGQHHKIISKS